VTERRTNLGLADSIISGVSDIVNRHGRVIVLEDDLVTSPYFLRFMNDALDFWESREEVASIHGYFYPMPEALPETFFLKGADCWGWATWKRAWDLFEPDGAKLLAQLRERGLEREFDRGGEYAYTRMLEDQIAGLNDSWAVRWHASTFLADRYTLYPGRALVQNIGNDAQGTHSKSTHRFDVKLADRPVQVSRIQVMESPEVNRALSRYFRSIRPSWLHRLKKALAPKSD
jgi:hypothetical protein